MSCMALLSYKHTISVIKKLKSSIKKGIYIGDIIIQVLFILYYAYCLYTRIDSLLWIIIYSILIVVSSLFFVYTLLSKNKTENLYSKPNRKKINLIVKNIKYLIRGFIIGYNVYLIATTEEVLVIQTLLTALSIFLYVLQIVCQVATHVLAKYLDLITESIRWDFEESDLLKAGISMMNPSEEKPKSIANKIISHIGKRLINKHVEHEEATIISEEQQMIRDKIKSFEESELLEISDENK